MPHFEGCVKAKEISLTRKGANPHAQVLVLKTAAGPAGTTQPENSTMTEAEKAAAAATAAAEVQKAALKIGTAIALMDDVTKSYFVALGEDAQVAFLAKSAADQKTEADVAKAAADKAALEVEAAKAGKTAAQLETEKSLVVANTRIEDLEKRLAEQDIEKRAATDFAGYPGGATAVVPLLKSFAKLPQAEREAAEAVLKSQCELAKASTVTYGARTDADVSKAASAKKKIEDAAKAYAAEHKCSYGDAYNTITEKPEFADDVAAIG